MKVAAQIYKYMELNESESDLILFEEINEETTPEVQMSVSLSMSY